jgi:high-affinity K+ transport system ATPase subunit B
MGQIGLERYEYITDQKDERKMLAWCWEGCNDAPVSVI